MLRVEVLKPQLDRCPLLPGPLTSLEKRFQNAEDELKAIGQQLQNPLTPEAKRALSERIEHLESEVQQIKADLNAEKRQQQRTSARNNANLGLLPSKITGSSSTGARLAK